MEKVDILKPPTFEKSGKVKTLKQAWKDEDWIGTFNLWIIQEKPVPAIIYQQRSYNSAWAPGKLDVTAGGHYEAGETVRDGLREVREELGRNYKFNDLTYIGRKLHVSFDVNGSERHNTVDIFFIKDNVALATYVLQKEEIYAICACPIYKLIHVHTEKNYRFTVSAMLSDGNKSKIVVQKSSFPYNWDNYHFKISLLADRFIKGEKHLLY